MLRLEFIVNEELWSIYAWWAAILILKLMTLTWITGRRRVKYKVFHSEEDTMWAEGPVTLCKTGGGHPSVDNIRQLHHRDLKLIVPYLLLTPIWLNNTPSTLLGKLSMRLFPIANIVFTLATLNESIACRFHCCRISSLIEYCILAYITFSLLLSFC